ncbi:MAG: hypothetical protein ACKOYM_04485 [Actinomycetes bacterium]
MASVEGVRIPCRIVVAVGTDVHPFDRLVRWADLWALEYPDDDVLVQFGTSRPPRWAVGVESMPRADLLAAFATADAVVVSCGPGAVMDARSMGCRPVVVARRHDLGEHVDDHQTVFADHLDDHALAVRVRTESDFRTMLAGAKLLPFRLDGPAVDVVDAGSGRERVAGLVDALVWSS